MLVDAFLGFVITFVVWFVLLAVPTLIIAKLRGVPTRSLLKYPMAAALAFGVIVAITRLAR